MGRTHAFGIRTARFWEYLNGGWVKLSLREGDTIAHHEGGAHEEGYSVTFLTYEYDGETVTREAHTDSRDCDGRTSETTIVECDVSKLATRAPYVDPGFVPTMRAPYDETYQPCLGAMFPTWERVKSRQRDYNAEAAGY